jgi:hypothetical protein
MGKCHCHSLWMLSVTTFKRESVFNKVNENKMIFFKLQAVLRIREVYPGSQIQQQHQKRREKTFFCPTIFLATNTITFIFEQVKKIVLAKTLKIIVLFTQKFVIKLSKIWVWNPRSQIQGQKGTRIPDP